MTLRKKILGGLAALIVVVAVVVAMVNITTKPTFSISTLGDDGYVTFPVECHAIGAGHVEGPDGPEGSVNLDGSQVFESMSGEDLKTYADEYGSRRGAPPGEDELSTQLIKVQENTTYQCGQLRESRQTGLLMTFGVSLLLLMSVGVVAILTEPRRELIEREKNGSHV